MHPMPFGPLPGGLPGFERHSRGVRATEVGDIIGASAVFRETSNLRDVRSTRPQEKLCEGACVVALPSARMEERTTV